MSSVSFSAESSPYVPYTEPITEPSRIARGRPRSAAEHPRWGSSFPGIAIEAIEAIEFETGLVQNLARRWRRERRRRKVGRAYDMALEIARMLPRQSRVLDVGCGNGFISHHISALMETDVLGIDLDANTEAPINYRQFDGTCFPVENQSFDAALLSMFCITRKTPMQFCANCIAY